MSQENLDAVRAVYAKWGKGNFRAGVDLYDPDVLLVQGEGLPDAGPYQGVEGIAGYMRNFLEAWERVTIEAEEFSSGGDSVVVAVVQRGIGRGSGAPAEFRYLHVWSFRGGRVIRLDAIRDRSVAFEAAGLAEPVSDE